MAKIALDLRWYGSAHSGVGLVNQYLLAELAKLDAEHEYLVFTGPAHWDEIPALPANFRKVRTTDSWFSFAEQTVFLRDLVRERPDLVHFTNFNAPILYPGKFACTIHDLTTIFYPGKKMPHFWRRWPFFLALGNAILRSRRVITVSEFTRSDIVRRFPVHPEKIAVTHLGPAPIPDEPSAAEILRVRTKYGVRPGAKYFLYTSVFRDHKNPDGLVRAFAQLASCLPDWDLVMAGRAAPVYLDPILAEVRAAGLEDRIHFTGMFPDSDRAGLLYGADVFVQPSFYEGFGMSLLDAMAAGTPIASSSAASLPEVGGDAAMYFDPHSVDEMASVLRRLAEDPSLRDTLVRLGRERVQTFSWRRMAEQVLAVYRDALR